MLGATTYTYDAFGRTATVSRTENGIQRQTVYSYNAGGQTLTVTEQPAGSVSSFEYDDMGRRTKATLPGGRVINYTYAPTGELLTVNGSDTYPQAYTYTALGQMKNLTTYRQFPGTADLTQWAYNPRGFMTAKTYADGHSVNYTYNPDGGLQTRAWSRGITTTYGYDNGGQLASVTYSDGVTPAVSYTLNRLGQPVSVVDGTGTHTLTYNDDATLASATAPYIVNHSVNYTYDAMGRRTGMQLKNGSTAVFSHNYTYDAMSRLATVGNGSVTATYSRVPGSSAIASTVINNGSTNVMTTARTYDNRSRLTAINSTAGATSRGYNYQYDDKDQRIKCTFADGSFWEYAYDDKGQVTGGIKKDASGKAMPGQSFGYAYDDIGNRTSEQRGMPEMLFSYAANNLNQYTQRTVPGIIPVTGSAATDATVKVRLPATNSVFNTVRDGVYYQAAVPVDNTASGSETNLEIHAVKFDTAQDKDIVKTITGKYWVDKTPQLFTYDLDGNMLFDGKWNSTWDGENRLLSSTNTANTQKLEYTYDYQSRRVSKKVYTKTAADIVWTIAKTEKYVYDKWNCIAMFNADNALQKSLLWGEDLSGSMQGAGGVGGLLAETNATGTYLPGYDGNGNIMTYLNAADQALVAEYVYDAFGRTLIKSGILADAFVYRFSTKPLDENGIYNYGRRGYNPEIGRWLSRDPIGEKDTRNLQCFVSNNPVSKIDMLGLWTKLGRIKQGRRMLYRQDTGDTNDGLAKIVGLDVAEFNSWAKWEQTVKVEPDDDNLHCGYSVPNVWIAADVLRGGSLYQRFIVNPGGTIGRFVGTDIFTDKKVVKANTIPDLMNVLNNNAGDIWGMVAFGHGTKGGNYFVTSNPKTMKTIINGIEYEVLDPTDYGIGFIHQRDIRSNVAKNNYKLASIYMMQCYSAAGIHKAAWENLAVTNGFFGYDYLNVALLDTEFEWLNIFNPAT